MSSPYRQVSSDENVRAWYIVKRTNGVPYLTSGRLTWVDPEWERTRPIWYRKCMEQCDGVIEATITGTFQEVWQYCMDHTDRSGGKL